jgi:hypothetical protein
MALNHLGQKRVLVVGAKGFELDLLVPNHKEKSKLLNWLELPCANLSLTALPFALRGSNSGRCW